MHGFSEVPWDQDNRVARFWSERMHPSEGLQHEAGLRLRPTKPGSGRLLQFFAQNRDSWLLSPEPVGSAVRKRWTSCGNLPSTGLRQARLSADQELGVASNQ